MAQSEHVFILSGFEYEPQVKGVRALSARTFENDGFWESWTLPLSPNIMQMRTFLIDGKVKLVNYKPNMKQNDSTEVLAFAKFKI